MKEHTAEYFNQNISQFWELRIDFNWENCSQNIEKCCIAVFSRIFSNNYISRIYEYSWFDELNKRVTRSYCWNIPANTVSTPYFLNTYKKKDIFLEKHLSYFFNLFPGLVLRIFPKHSNPKRINKKGFLKIKKLFGRLTVRIGWRTARESTGVLFVA